MAENSYDTDDIVRREGLMLAEGLKFAAYRVREPTFGQPDEPNVWSNLQFHLLWVPTSKGGDDLGFGSVVNLGGNVLCGAMDEEVAVAFGDFVDKVEADPEPYEGKQHLLGPCMVSVYRRGDDKLEFQVRVGRMVLGVLSLTMAKLFTNCVRRFRGEEDLPPADTHPAIKRAQAEGGPSYGTYGKPVGL